MFEQIPDSLFSFNSLCPTSRTQEEKISSKQAKNQLFFTWENKEAECNNYYDLSAVTNVTHDYLILKSCKGRHQPSIWSLPRGASSFI